MKFVLSLFREEFSSLVREELFSEILFHPLFFSKSGEFPLRKIPPIAKQFKTHGIKTVLNWDRLFTDEQIEKLTKEVEELDLSSIDAFRFLDWGFAKYFCEKFPSVKIQLNGEHDTHNLKKIQTVEKIFDPSPDKITLSNEIPFRQILDYLPNIQSRTEILGVGRLELFHTPRPLIQRIFPSDSENLRTAEISSLERPSSLKHFYVEHAEAGTMFYERDLFLPDALFDWEEEFTDSEKFPEVRLDFYHSRHFEAFQKGGAISQREKWENLREEWGKKTTGGFFRVNKTKSQFSRLKNQNLRGEKKKIGEVLESCKNRHLFIRIDFPTNLDLEFEIVNPFGKRIPYELRALQGEFKIDEGKKIIPGVYFCEWKKEVPPGSILAICRDDKIADEEVSVSE